MFHFTPSAYFKKNLNYFNIKDQLNIVKQELNNKLITYCNDYSIFNSKKIITTSSPYRNFHT